MEGEMRSRYGGGQHCKVAESAASKSNSWASSPCGADMRGRPSRSRARLRPMLVAPIRSRLNRCPSCPASVLHAGLRHCRSPRISATRPHGVRGRVDSIQWHRPHRDEQLRQVWDVMYSGVQMTRNCLASARAIPMPMAGGLPLRPTVPGLRPHAP
eukprot:scaffold5741_cov114-Isochrysis_galbana.AAC.4